ncbi:MAG: RsmD family RNA methyltransferase [Planctomycetia bacterium]
MRILAGRFKGRALPVPPQARPAGARLRTSLFGVLGATLEGARVLDVCAGAGGLGLEALSRGAARVTLLERDPASVRMLAAWIERVGAHAQAEALRCDVLARAWPQGPFDLVLLDPPFEFWADTRALGLLDRAAEVLAPGGRAVLKLPTRQVLPLGPRWRLLERRAAGDAAFALLEALPARGTA